MADLKTALAKKNGYSEERYIELVRERVAEKYSHYSEEVALLRKEIAYLRDVIEKLIGQALATSDFIEYNNIVESIKTDAKAEMIC